MTVVGKPDTSNPAVQEVSRAAPAPGPARPPVGSGGSNDAVRISFSSEGLELSRRHGRARQIQNFKAIDTDGDKQLNEEELRAAQERRQAAGHQTPFINRVLDNYSKMDADGSGGISFKEAHPRPPGPIPVQEAAPNPSGAPGQADET